MKQIIFSIPVVLVLSLLLLGGAEPLSAQEECWKCVVEGSPPETFCEETTSDGYVDCDENMSHTRCSVEDYDSCEESETMALLTSGSTIVSPNFLPPQGALSFPAVGQIVRSCQGFLIGRIYPGSHRTSVRTVTAEITL